MATDARRDLASVSHNMINNETLALSNRAIKGSIGSILLVLIL
jgi:hypothetical protein